MQAKSCLILENYIVNKMNFLFNKEFGFENNNTIDINPEFQRIIKKIDQNTASVQLIIRINNINNNSPFSLEVNIEGIFYLEEWENENNVSVIETNAVAILFPYLRTIVTMLTANANVPPYVLPVMNISALFEKANSI